MVHYVYQGAWRRLLESHASQHGARCHSAILTSCGPGWGLLPHRMEHGSMDHDAMFNTMAPWVAEPCYRAWLHGRRSHAVEHGSMGRGATFKTMAPWTAETCCRAWILLVRCHAKRLFCGLILKPGYFVPTFQKRSVLSFLHSSCICLHLLIVDDIGKTQIQIILLFDIFFSSSIVSLSS